MALSSAYETEPSDSGRGVSRSWAALGAACAPIVGVAIYSGYLHLQFADALAWMHGQAAWGLPLLGRPAAPDPVDLPGIPRINVIEVVAWIGNIASFVIAAASIGPVWKRFGGAYALWIVVNIFPPVVTHLFLSLGRFVAVLFPVFFWLALRIPPSKLRAVAAAFLAGQVTLAVWFFLWRPVV